MTDPQEREKKMTRFIWDFYVAKWKLEWTIAGAALMVIIPGSFLVMMMNGTKDVNYEKIAAMGSGYLIDGRWNEVNPVDGNEYSHESPDVRLRLAQVKDPNSVSIRGTLPMELGGKQRVASFDLVAPTETLPDDGVPMSFPTGGGLKNFSAHYRLKFASEATWKLDTQETCVVPIAIILKLSSVKGAGEMTATAPSAAKSSCKLDESHPIVITKYFSRH